MNRTWRTNSGSGESAEMTQPTLEYVDEHTNVILGTVLPIKQSDAWLAETIDENDERFSVLLPSKDEATKYVENSMISRSNQ